MKELVASGNCIEEPLLLIDPLTRTSTNLQLGMTRGLMTKQGLYKRLVEGLLGKKHGAKNKKYRTSGI
jgi:hypothetical protein